MAKKAEGSTFGMNFIIILLSTILTKANELNSTDGSLVTDGTKTFYATTGREVSDMGGENDFTLESTLEEGSSLNHETIMTLKTDDGVEKGGSYDPHDSPKVKTFLYELKDYSNDSSTTKAFKFSTFGSSDTVTSRPLQYEFDSSLKETLRENMNNLKQDLLENKIYKRQSNVNTDFNKIKLKTFKKVKENFELGSDIDVGFRQLRKGSLFCKDATENRIQLSFISSSVKVQGKLQIPGNFPCHIIPNRNVMAYLKANESGIVQISRIFDKNPVYVQTLDHLKVPGHPVDIGSWDHGGESFLALKFKRNSKMDSTTTSFYIYVWTNGRYKLQQHIESKSTGKAHHFEIGSVSYLAIPTFRENEYDERRSDIYVYSSKEEKYIPFQKLKIPAITSIEAFNVENSNLSFLVATSYCLSHDTRSGKCDPYTSAIIYKFNGVNFEVFQKLSAFAVTQSFVIEYKGEVFLCTVSPLNGILVYQYNGEKFIETNPELGDELISEGISKIQILEINSKVFLAVLSNLDMDFNWILFEVLFGNAENSVTEREMASWCAKALHSSQSRFTEVKTRLQNTPLKTQPLRIDDIRIEELEINNGLSVPVFTKEVQNEFEVKLENLENKAKHMTEHLRKVETNISEAINVNETTDWPDNLRLSSVVILAAKTNKFFAQFVTGQKVPSVDELVPLNSREPVTLGTKTFEDVAFKKSLKVEVLNGHFLSSYVTLGGNYHLKRHIIFDHIVTPNIKVGHLIDNVAVNEESLGVLSGSQNFKGSLSCTSIKISNIETNYINGINMEVLMRETYAANSSIRIAGDLHIYGDLIYSGDLEVGALLGRNPNFFKDEILLLESGEPQVINGNIVIENMKTKEISVREINEIPFADSVIVDLPVKIYHLNKANFESIDADFVTVDNSINEIKVVDGTLDVVTLHENQVITAMKNFKGMHLQNTLLYKKNTVDEIERPYTNTLSENEFRKEFKYYKTSVKLREQVSAENNILNILRNLRTGVMRILETKPVSLQPSALKYDDRTYPRIIRVLGEVSSVLETLIHYLKNKNFTEIESLATELSQVDKMQLNRLNSFRTVPEYMFKSALKLYSFADIALIKLEEFINEKKEVIASVNESNEKYDKIIKRVVQKYDMENIASKGSFVSGLISGYRLQDLDSTSRSYEDILDTNTILRKVAEAEKVVFMKALRTQRINHINVNRLIDQIVPLSSTETNLDLVFEQPVMVQGDVSVSYMNDVVTNYYARLGSTNVFEKAVEFQDISFTNEIKVKGKANNYKIDDITSKIARIDIPQTFEAPIIFKTASVKSVNYSHASLKQLPIEEFIFVDVKENVITGKKQFRNISIQNSLVTVRDLHTEELGQINLTESFDNRIVREDIRIDNSKLIKLKVIGNVNVLRYMKNSKRENINLSRLLEDRLQDNSEIIQGSLVFKGNVYARKLHYNSTFDGISADIFSSGLVLDSENQELKGRNYFKELNVKNLIIKDNVLQGVDVNRLVQKSVKIDENVHFLELVTFGNISSAKSLEVEGLVQGWNLSRDAVLHSESPQVVTGSKTFLAPTRVKGEITVKGLVNGIDIEAICKSVLGEVLIQDSVHFGKGFMANKVSAGDFSIPRDQSTFWMTDKTSSIDSEVVFENIVADRVYIGRKVNGESIDLIENGPIPSSCEGKIDLGNWTINTVVAETVQGKEIRANNLNGESSRVLQEVVLNSIDQEFDHVLRAPNLEVIDVDTRGVINDLHMSDFCVKRLNCQIKASKTLLGVLGVRGNWNVGDESFINQTKVKDLKESTMDGSTVKVIIDGSIHSPSIFVIGLLNDVRFGEDTIMTLNSNQTMNGSLLITNRNKLAFEAKDVRILNQLYDGVNLSFIKPIGQAVPIVEKSEERKLNELLSRYRTLTENVFSVHSVAQSYPESFLGWNLTDTFDGFDRIIPLEDSEESAVFLVALLSSKGIYLKSYTPYNNAYKDYAFIKMNCPSDAKAFYMNEDLFVAASSNCPSPNVNLTGVSQVFPDTTAVEERIFSFVWKCGAHGPSLYSAIATSEATQILRFSVLGRDCLMFVNIDTPRQYILCEDDSSLILQQSLKFGRVIRALNLVHKSANGLKSLLIIGSLKTDTQISTVRVLQLNERTGHHEVIQEIPGEGLIWLTAKSLRDSLLLVTVHEPFIGSTLGCIKIYRLKEENEGYDKPLLSNLGFTFEESIFLADPLQAAFLDSPSGEVVLIVLSKSEFIIRYVKRGFGKFQKFGSLHIPGANFVDTWVWKRDRANILTVSTVRYYGQKVKKQVQIFTPIYSGFN